MKIIAALLLATAAMPAMAAVNLVNNGSFESGFSGWQQFGNTNYNGTTGEALGQDPTDGLSQAYFGPVGNTGGIFQNIATTAGETYRLSFDMFAAPGGQQFRVSFGNDTVLNSSFSSGNGYTTYFYDVVANAANSQLRFRTQHNPSYYLLDNVRVEQFSDAVPEPATWAMLITGFGFVGSAMRRRRSSGVAARVTA